MTILDAVGRWVEKLAETMAANMVTLSCPEEGDHEAKALIKQSRTVLVLNDGRELNVL